MSHRVFTDPSGTDWQVWDVHPSTAADSIQLRPEYASGWLAFESPQGRRRLVPIPNGWEGWPSEELCAACSRATPHKARRRLIE